MPTYQYACTECAHFFEQFQSFDEDSLTVCPECEGRLRKVFNAVGVVFKGSGFYRTDSRSDGSRNGSTSSDSGKSSSSSDSGKSSDSGSSSSSSDSGSKSSSSSDSGSRSSSSTGSKATSAA